MKYWVDQEEVCVQVFPWPSNRKIQADFLANPIFSWKHFGFGILTRFKHDLSYMSTRVSVFFLLPNESKWCLLFIFIIRLKTWTACAWSPLNILSLLLLWWNVCPGLTSESGRRSKIPTCCSSHSHQLPFFFSLILNLHHLSWCLPVIYIGQCCSDCVSEFITCLW